jgi:hypothetical protein
MPISVRQPMLLPCWQCRASELREKDGRQNEQRRCQTDTDRAQHGEISHDREQ